MRRISPKHIASIERLCRVEQEGAARAHQDMLHWLRLGDTAEAKAVQKRVKLAHDIAWGHLARLLYNGAQT